MDKTKEEKEREAKPDRREMILIRTRTCALSNEALEPGSPVVADEVGSLYSKEALLKRLLDKNLPVEFSHIRGLRDVIECRFFANPSSAEERKSEDGSSKGAAVVQWSSENDSQSPYSCPISGVEMNGRQPFVVIRGTSKPVNVLSERAIKQVGLPALQEEYGPFTADDVITLIPSDEVKAQLVARMATRREEERKRKAEKQKKKDKKRKQGGGEAADAAQDVAAASKKSKQLEARNAGKAAKVTDPTAVKYLGDVMSEAEKLIQEQKQANSTYNSLFKGKGSQKAGDATHQFIVQSSFRYNLG